MDAEITPGHITFEIAPMVFSVRIYGERNRDDHVSSFQCFKYGDVGLAYAITGAGFYGLLPTLIGKIFRELQVSSLQGYVTKAHHRAMAFKLRGLATVAVLWTGRCAGREMLWVKVTADDN